jgi:hypothetical protein
MQYFVVILPQLHHHDDCMLVKHRKQQCKAVNQDLHLMQSENSHIDDHPAVHAGC